MTDTAFLLAGQGAYRPGMFAEYSVDGAVDNVVAVVDAVAAEFGRSGVRTLLLNPNAPTAADLARTDPFALQLAVFTTVVIEYQRIAQTRTQGVLVGHSLGELAALTVAGGFDLADGARLVCHRSEALARTDHEPGGMLAMELSASRAAHVVGAVDDRRLSVAVVNAPARTVIAGPDVALDLVRRVATALDVRTVRLPAPFAFHSPGLALAALEFAEAAAVIRQRPLRVPVYSPLLADYVADTVDFVALLVRHLTTPVNFLAAIRRLHVDGLRAVVECGRSGLATLVLSSVPNVVTDADLDMGIDIVSTVSLDPVPPSKTIHGMAVGPGSVADMVVQLQELYASTLGYPVEAMDPDADLEADLGIDSLKRAEMVGKVGAKFGLSESVNHGRFLAHTTLAELAKLITSTPDGREA